MPTVKAILFLRYTCGIPIAILYTKQATVIIHSEVKYSSVAVPKSTATIKSIPKVTGITQLMIVGNKVSKIFQVMQ